MKPETKTKIELKNDIHALKSSMRDLLEVIYYGIDTKKLAPKYKKRIKQAAQLTVVCLAGVLLNGCATIAPIIEDPKPASGKAECSLDVIGEVIDEMIEDTISDEEMSRRVDANALLHDCEFLNAKPIGAL